MKATDDNRFSLVANNGVHLALTSSSLSRRRRAAISYYLEASLSPNTIRAYKSDLRMFLDWGGAIPSSSEELASYLAEQADWLSPFTLIRRLSAIRRAHKNIGYPDPSKHPTVEGVLRGIWRRHGSRPRQARPLLLHDLNRMLPESTGAKQVRDRAILLIGFRSALRRAELCRLNVEDFALSSAGLLLQVRKSKTDQEAKGRQIAIPYANSGPCAVQALRMWLHVANVEAGAAFRSIDRWGSIKGRLSPQSISLILRHYACRAGVDITGLSAHSLRAGFVTSAAQAGASVYAIQQQTGHTSIEMVSRYVRATHPFDGNANEGLS